MRLIGVNLALVRRLARVQSYQNGGGFVGGSRVAVERERSLKRKLA